MREAVSQYLAEFHFPLDTWLIIAAITAAMYVIMGLASKQWTSRKNIFLPLLIGYTSWVLCFTVFCRATVGITLFKIIPFWSYREILNGDEVTLLVDILNIILFMPIGFLLPLSFNKVNWRHALAIGFLLSLTIELLQLFMQKGLCEFDDLFHNTLGCMIGYLIGRAIVKARARIQKRPS